MALIAGVDEAGRGPLAGPVVAAAVILPREFDLPGLNDSKKYPRGNEKNYSRRSRNRLYPLVLDRSTHRPLIN